LGCLLVFLFCDAKNSQITAARMIREMTFSKVASR
jgi:hypothetical protein